MLKMSTKIPHCTIWSVKFEPGKKNTADALDSNFNCPVFTSKKVAYLIYLCATRLKPGQLSGST